MRHAHHALVPDADARVAPRSISKVVTKPQRLVKDHEQKLSEQNLCRVHHLGVLEEHHLCLIF
jgi:hypothetical protein